MNSIDLMGDPHLSKVFQHGVPLHHRGEREELVWQAFETNLHATTAGLHVCMGDLFDRAIVPHDAILRAADIYATVAAATPDTRFIILRGNHDLLRDLERASAFDLFAHLVASAPVSHSRMFDLKRVRPWPNQRLTIGTSQSQLVWPYLQALQLLTQTERTGPMSGTAARFDVYEQITNHIVAAIETAGEFRLPWITRTGGSFARPVNIASRNPYNGVNVLSLWIAALSKDYPSNVWGTYLQSRQQGCQVRRGEKSSLVVFYRKLPSDDDTPDMV